MWEKIARENQKPPSSDWYVWLIMAGRGFGKTRTGAETVLDLIGQRYKNIAFVGHTIQEAWHVMVNGISGLKVCFARRCSDVLSIHKIDRQILT
jgi:phage terminase large subunit-like protein